MVDKDFKKFSSWLVEGSEFCDVADTKFISTGFSTLNWLLGRPGIPLGRIVEVIGTQSSGKSTLCAHLATRFFHLGGKVVVLDSEHSYTPDWVMRFNWNMKDTLFGYFDYLEDACEFLEIACRKATECKEKYPSLFIIDSLSALPVKDESIGDISIGLHARVVSKTLRIVTNLIWKSHTALIFVSHQKTNPLQPFSAAVKIGGHAIDYHAAVQIKLGKVIEKPDFQRIKLTTIKNKLFGVKRSICLDLYFETSCIDESYQIACIAKDVGWVQESGGWYTDTVTGEKMRLSEVGKKYANRIMELVEEGITGQNSDEEVDEHATSKVE